MSRVKFAASVGTPCPAKIGGMPADSLYIVDLPVTCSTTSVFSHALDLNDMRQFAELHDIELTVIDNDTRLPAFKDALRWNEVYYGSKR